MSKELMNLFLFIFMCFILYLIFRHFNYEKTIVKEGLTDLSGNMIISPPNGIAGNASRYAATIKAENIQMQDLFLINKYRTDYESIILNLDDYLNNTMLHSTILLFLFIETLYTTLKVFYYQQFEKMKRPCVL